VPEGRWRNTGKWVAAGLVALTTLGRIGARGVAIRRGLEDQLGLVVEDLTPFGLAGSAGSTPLRIKLSGDPPTYLFGKLYARSHLRADRCTSWAEAPHVLGFTTRAALQQALSQRSGGRLQLDPEQAR
jgi:hypothetical protein